MLHDITTYLIHLYDAIGQHLAYKVMVSLGLVVSSFMFGDLYNEAMLGVVMLISIDFWTGLTASKLEGTPITSRRGLGSILKGTVYLVSISAAHFADLTVPGAFIQMTMIAFVGVNEFISILENVGRMGFRTPQKLLNQLRTKYD
jgi:phage-related holin